MFWWWWRSGDTIPQPLEKLLAIGLLPGDAPIVWPVPTLTRGDGSKRLEHLLHLLWWQSDVRLIPLAHFVLSPWFLGGAALAWWSPAALRGVFVDVLVNKMAVTNPHV